jgi:phosphate-selective porin
LVNDAFVEYYLNDHTTIRAGQFVKPFGFDIQQSSSVRESPERAIFAGYFFPGQRDRGILLSGDLRFMRVAAKTCGRSTSVSFDKS